MYKHHNYDDLILIARKQLRSEYFRLRSGSRGPIKQGKSHAGGQKTGQRKPITWVRAPAPRVSSPLLQPCKVFDRTHEQRIALSPNGGFLEDVVTYVYPVNFLGRFWETYIPRASVAERSPRSADRVLRPGQRWVADIPGTFTGTITRQVRERPVMRQKRIVLAVILIIQYLHTHMSEREGVEVGPSSVHEQVHRQRRSRLGWSLYP